MGRQNVRSSQAQMNGWLGPDLVSSSFAPPIRDRITGLGAVFDPEVASATRELLSKPGPALPVTIRSDLAYGPDARHRADVYVPDRAAAPMLVFVPGGGFVGGDKSRYAALGSFFARAGYLTVIANYRLAPAAPFPAGSDDVDALLLWCLKQGHSLGGSAAVIHLVGHSAGATHCALALFDPRHRPAICSLTLLSGLYQLAGRDPGAGPVQYFGSDPSLQRTREPLSRARRLAIPVIVGRAELDPPDLFEDSARLVEALTRAGSSVRFVEFAGHNHISTVTGLGIPGHGVGEALLSMLAAYEPRRDAHGQS
jgi:triacylglycerol lipase